jgi:hypothetical protein
VFSRFPRRIPCWRRGRRRHQRRPGQTPVVREHIILREHILTQNHQRCPGQSIVCMCVRACNYTYTHTHTHIHTHTRIHIQFACVCGARSFSKGHISSRRRRRKLKSQKKDKVQKVHFLVVPPWGDTAVKPRSHFSRVCIPPTTSGALLSP